MSFMYYGKDRLGVELGTWELHRKQPTGALTEVTLINTCRSGWGSH